MGECGLTHLIRDPIKLFGDSHAANELTTKDFISTYTGNLYIYQPYPWPYHWIKLDKIISERQLHYYPLCGNQG